MAGDNLTGSRIRERRLIAGMRQADLARHIGISASYLNLIEHNRRRIGGKLLNALALALDVEPAVLTEGAEATLITALRDAEAAIEPVNAELDRVDEFAERFPGWAGLLAALHQRTLQLEQTVEGLNDRLTHDPQLAASVHEVLSTAASIRSTASILAETDQLEKQWLARFHANINQDSARLAESSRALANYLEGNQEQDVETALVPQDEVDAFLALNNFAFPLLEADQAGTPEDILRETDMSKAAQHIARKHLETYLLDAHAVPLDRMRDALGEAEESPDPIALAQSLAAPVSVVMRRLSHLPDLSVGYVYCDRAGSLLWRRPIPGFVVPRGGNACPLWPVFAAFSQPGMMVQADVSQQGRQQTRFRAYAVTDPVEPAAYNQMPLLRGGMLLVPNITLGPEDDAYVELGSACRLCSKSNCAGRREPSVLLSR